MAVSEDYLVAGRVRLGALLDLIAAFLDALDDQYDLYPEDASSSGTRGGDAKPISPPQRAG